VVLGDRRARAWRPLIRSLPQVPDTTRYNYLRYTDASLLGGAGVSPTLIAARLGHASTGQFEAYVHPYPSSDEGKATRDAIDQAFGKPPAEGPAAPVNTASIPETMPDLQVSAENVDFVD
jgi:hypothetical protein